MSVISTLRSLHSRNTARMTSSLSFWYIISVSSTKRGLISNDRASDRWVLHRVSTSLVRLAASSGREVLIQNTHGRTKILIHTNNCIAFYFICLLNSLNWHHAKYHYDNVLDRSAKSTSTLSYHNYDNIVVLSWQKI